jgi:hypothetical protein
MQLPSLLPPKNVINNEKGQSLDLIPKDRWQKNGQILVTIYNDSSPQH